MLLSQPFQSRLNKKLKEIRWKSYINEKFHYEQSFRRFWRFRSDQTSRKMLRFFVTKLRELENPLT